MPVYGQRQGNSMIGISPCILTLTHMNAEACYADDGDDDHDVHDDA
jgi:hypothetical protein